MAKQKRIPGQHHRRSVVTSALHESEGGGLRGYERTIIDTNCFDGRWSGMIEGVAFDGQGRRWRLRHEQLVAIYRHMTAIMADRRSDRAHNAASTRKMREAQLNSLTPEDREQVERMAAEIEAETSLTKGEALQRAIAIFQEEGGTDALGQRLQAPDTEVTRQANINEARNAMRGGRR